MAREVLSRGGRGGRRVSRVPGRRSVKAAGASVAGSSGRDVAVAAQEEGRLAVMMSDGEGEGRSVRGDAAAAGGSRAANVAGGSRSGGERGAPPLGVVRPDRVLEVNAGRHCRIHVEIDEPDHADPGMPTIVFSHGFALSLDSWHFQRKHMKGRYRTVFWDQRGHGRSPRCANEQVSIDLLGRDLECVIEAAAPTGPLIVVGHSMGGMTVMAYAARRAADFAHRIIGVGLVATTSFNLKRNSFGWGYASWLLHGSAPGVLSAASKLPEVTRRSREWAAGLERFFVRRYSFASDVPAEVADQVAWMINTTPVEVLNDYFPQFRLHDKRDALAVMEDVESLVLVGDADLLTPPSYSERIIRRLPHAEHVIVDRAGHMVMLEYPHVVNKHLDDLVARTCGTGHSIADQ